MQAPNHPKPRTFDSREIFPSIHWALFHQGFAGPGVHRRIYDFELLYVIQGEIRAWFDDDVSGPIPVQTGDLLLIPSATAYRLELLTVPSVQLLGIHFDFYDEVPIAAEQDIVVSEDRVKPDKFGFLPVDSDGEPQFARHYAGIPAEIVSRMEEIVKRHAAAEVGFEMACRGLLLQILA